MPGRIKSDRAEVITLLQRGGVGVLGTDTIYGLVGSALSKETVERIYRIKERDLNKPMVILIGSIDDLTIFNIKLNDVLSQLLSRVWPGGVSVILPCSEPKFEYLHRGTQTLALRLPKKDALINILQKTGPLVAPSANPEGLAPARTVEEAKHYFGDKVDFYIDEGILDGSPSTLAALQNGKLITKRHGAVVLE